MNKYDSKMMKSAYDWSTQSHCKRRQVGAVLAKDGREIASGYNGTISGSKSNSCEDYYYECPECNIRNINWQKIFTINRGLNIDDPYNSSFRLTCNNCIQPLGFVSEPDDVSEYKISITKDTTIHAERNIIAYCAKHGIATKGCTMYITLSPCEGCAVLMAQAGITKVLYKEKYKDISGIKILKDAGITVRQFEG